MPKSPSVTSIGLRLRAARGDRSRAEVARAAQIDYSTLWRWECDKQEPTDLPALRRLVVTLGISLDEVA